MLAALPLAFCGIVGSLFITQTTLSIPSLMGAIMSIGVASANSILLVTFAREYREATGCSATEAAIVAGRTRLRPVLMTAGAMFVGMLPMSLGLAEGWRGRASRPLTPRRWNCVTVSKVAVKSGPKLPFGIRHIDFERIVVGPPADIAEGQQVKVATQAVEPKTGAK